MFGLVMGVIAAANVDPALIEAAQAAAEDNAVQAAVDRFGAAIGVSF